MKNRLLKSAGVFVLSLMCAGAAETVLFQENFESGALDQWASGHHGIIVADPLQAANHVLTFTSLNAGGDIFTAAALPVGESNRHYVVKFDYLGLFVPGSGENLGGFLGIFISASDPHYWIAGTADSGLNTPLGVHLTDDGTWHHYEINITPLIQENHLTQVHLMLEDWFSSGGVPGDAYFDNIQFVVAPNELTLEDIVPCAGPTTGGSWRNHGQYVSAVAAATRNLVKDGVITPRQRAMFMKEAAQARCGSKAKKK